MLRKSILSLILGTALLFAVFTLVSARGQGQAINQMDMNTPTSAPLPVEPTPIPDLPLSDTQSGACPMMSGTGMTGMNGMSGMQGMQGMGMNGMSGMQGMSGMNMGGMPGMNNSMTYIPVPWYSDPWWLLGWVLLGLVVVAILTGAVYGFVQIIRRSKAVQASTSS